MGLGVAVQRRTQGLGLVKAQDVDDQSDFVAVCATKLVVQEVPGQLLIVDVGIASMGQMPNGLHAIHRKDWPSP